MGWWTTAVIVLTLVQVGLGTQVREQVDDALAIVPRDQALAQVGALDTTHRELAAIAALAVVALWARIWTGHAADGALRRAVNLALACTGAQVAAGVMLTAGLPPAAQVLHLTLASLMLGALTATAFIAWRWTPRDDAI